MLTLRDTLLCLMAISSTIYAERLRVVWSSSSFSTISGPSGNEHSMAMVKASESSMRLVSLSTIKTILTTIHPVSTPATAASLPLKVTAGPRHASSNASLHSQALLRLARSRMEMEIASALVREVRMSTPSVSPLLQPAVVQSNSIPIATAALLMTATVPFTLPRVKEHHRVVHFGK